STRASNHLDTNAAVAAVRQILPSPMSSAHSSTPCPPEEMISTTNLSYPPTLSIPSVSYQSNSYSLQYRQQGQEYQHRMPPTRQRHRSLSNGGSPYAIARISQWEGESMNSPTMRRGPSLPMAQHQLQLQQYHQYLGNINDNNNSNNNSNNNNSSDSSSSSNSHQSGYTHQPTMGNQQWNHPNYRQQQQQQPSMSSTPPPFNNAPVVRHPLWRLECSSCKATLCEQAMQGHLVGDPSKKLFSTNLAIG
ncbi:hypothetical protein BX616_011070, partial [Lobosporangium transversale]